MSTIPTRLSTPIPNGAIAPPQGNLQGRSVGMMSKENFATYGRGLKNALHNFSQSQNITVVYIKMAALVAMFATGLLLGYVDVVFLNPATYLWPKTAQVLFGLGGLGCTVGTFIPLKLAYKEWKKCSRISFPIKPRDDIKIIDKNKFEDCKKKLKTLSDNLLDKANKEVLYNIIFVALAITLTTLLFFSTPANLFHGLGDFTLCAVTLYGLKLSHEAGEEFDKLKARFLQLI